MTPVTVPPGVNPDDLHIAVCIRCGQPVFWHRGLRQAVCLLDQDGQIVEQKLTGRWVCRRCAPRGGL